MWTHENGKAILDIGKVDRSEFKVVDDPQRGLHLIFPRKGKWNWLEGEKWLRSVVIDDSGAIVSCAWKKFGNYGEFLDETGILIKELEHGRTVRFTQKMDGSLCVRSVINGKVILRTRGTLYGGDMMAEEEGRVPFGERFHKVANEKYPKLLDPFWIPSGKSLLLEYVAPDNAIVVRYSEEDLIFLGGIEHSGPSILTWEESQQIAEDGGLRLVDTKELPRNPLLMLEEVKGWKAEGVVIRCNGDQTFVKVKSEWYKINHFAKSNMDYGTIAEFIEVNGIAEKEKLESFLFDNGFDFEIVSLALVLYDRYREIEADARRIQCEAENKFAEFVSRKWIGPEKDRRKEYAKMACLQKPFVKSLMFLMYDGKKEEMETLVRKYARSENHDC